ncbi:hypothetical protein FT663_04996 [Candidozyma haemuli var. vulneris]|uniref:OPT family small oligopeptide transporter n=1 Tax=Candidozyma haemuli TaxID=45357 RepID=A0A2V1B0Z6_9ASCO|nr:OPT family small oligopeptide transporter [[Candida] haemuloni]KAF3986162.1 hypothetical protein FT663_04996 [[Candida] haemuloni var. vulneris]KAF3988850.1 hypothetical protein FT662_03159 [[Candida] haemuloni var. vulneris]PVH23466.1 OPT family small oligopeptide transporter [[Candida] haemuloni]
MSEKIDHITSITSTGNRHDAADHEVDLQAVRSEQYAVEGIAEDLTLEQKYYIIKRLNYENLENFEDLPATAAFILEKIEHLSAAESEVILKDFLEEHDGDINVSIEDYDFVKTLVDYPGKETSGKVNFNNSSSDEKQEAVVREHSLSSEESGATNKIFDWDLQIRTEAALVAYWSPYAEVRAVTDPFDDPETPCETFRVYVIGIIWVVLGTVIGQFFVERQPGISLSSAVVQLFVFPCGKLLEAILPAKKINIWRWSIDLNPGPWSHKEQMLATLCYSVSGGAVYATYFINLQKLDRFYANPSFKIGAQFLMVFASNFMGFGFAGVFRKYVVYPTAAIFPNLLPTLAINRALAQPEKKETINGWRISRYSFFLIVFGASFLYFWVPDYLFQALSTFNWISWAAPNNFNVAIISGSQTGLGLNPITTFDWNYILGAPLSVPFFATINNYLGSLVGFICIVGLYWSNYKWTAYLPINSNSIFTNTGQYYSVTAVLDSNQKLDQEKYEQLGPPFYSAANMVAYGTFFALYPLNFFYVILTEWKKISFATVSLFKSFNFKRRSSTYEGFDDPFSTSMKVYPEVPEWWFFIILIISIVFSIITVEVYDLQTPVWTIFFALALNFVFLLPFVIVYASTGTSMSINVLLEMIIGYALPGNGTALNYVKTLGTNIDAQAENYITNQKQAHYWRIAPRALFRVQVVSVVLNSLVSVGILNVTLNTIDDYCMPGQSQKFTCPGTNTFYSASVLWGVIGPKRVFGGLYPIFQWCFLIGFLLAFPCWAAKRYFGKYAVVKYFHPVVFAAGLMNFAPYNLSYYTPALYLSFVFMYYLKSNKLAWWQKYNYLLSGGLSGGIAFSSIIIFFAVQYHSKPISWWGNNVNDNVLEATYPSRLNATLDAPGGYFGPRAGHYP